MTAVYAQQQTKTLAGTVVDARGEIITGASVSEKGTTNAVMTDVDGKFSITVQEGATLNISFLGYKTQSYVVGAANTAQIVLQEDSKELDEVVVVGYGMQKKKLVTGATVQVKGADIARMNTPNVLGALQSQAPGVEITQVRRWF